MTRRLVEMMQDEQLTFILMTEALEDYEIITSLLYQHGFPMTIYRTDFYKELTAEVEEIFNYPPFPAIFVGGKFIGDTKALLEYLEDESTESSDDCFDIQLNCLN